MTDGVQFAGGDERLPAPTPVLGPRLFSIAELLSEPDLDDLVKGLLPARSVTCLCSQPGAGKTFFSLGLALSVAFGVPFLGRGVKQGPVVYVSLEGRAGFPGRLRVWLQHSGLKPESAPLNAFSLVAEPIPFTDAFAIDSLIARLDELGVRPVLFVIDTFARSLAGEDENDAGVVGHAVAEIDRLRFRYSATVLVLHHFGKGGTDARGSSALRAAVDQMLFLRVAGSIRTIHRDKSRDQKLGPDLSFTLKMVPSADSPGRESSCVPVLSDPRESDSVSHPPENASDQAILSALSQPENSDGLCVADLARLTKLAEATIYRRLKRLESKGLCAPVPDSKPQRWRLHLHDCEGDAS